MADLRNTPATDAGKIELIAKLAGIVRNRGGLLSALRTAIDDAVIDAMEGDEAAALDAIERIHHLLEPVREAVCDVNDMAEKIMHACSAETGATAGHARPMETAQ